MTAIRVVTENAPNTKQMLQSHQKMRRKRSVTDPAAGHPRENVGVPILAATVPGVTKASHMAVVLVRIAGDRVVIRGRRVVAETSTRNRRDATTACRKCVDVAAAPATPEGPGINGGSLVCGGRVPLIFGYCEQLVKLFVVLLPASGHLAHEKR